MESNIDKLEEAKYWMQQWAQWRVKTTQAAQTAAQTAEFWAKEAKQAQEKAKEAQEMAEYWAKEAEEIQWAYELAKKEVDNGK